ncbi:hypothetical protein [Methanosarcina mazei]
MENDSKDNDSNKDDIPKGYVWMSISNRSKFLKKHLPQIKNMD